MTDEQLTRRAAEIMGLDLTGAEWKDSAFPGGGMGPALRLGDWYTGWPYRPLHDTDQAMDLAAELGMALRWILVDARATTHKTGVGRIVKYADHNGDKKAAMRRAIVECAGQKAG